ncbi:DUF1266 domain-containing protein [Bacillus paramycoides]|uniref:DUF1266 domain-containing protein n=1 Tax=Bacillus paramycoides TaxID=2026194 RepID=UPI003D1DA312
MPVLYKRKREKQLELYFRCLSSVCLNCFYLTNYFTRYEFTLIRDRFIGKRFLKNVLWTWKIENSTELKEKIIWFLEEGTRQEFNRIRHQLTPLSDAARKQLSKDHPDYEKLYIANYGLHILTDSGIVAFDYAWCICLCRVGRRLGYLSKQEAKDFMIQAAQLSQHSYSDWHEYFNAFRIGSHFNTNDIEFINKDKYNINYVSNLFDYKKTLLSVVPWENNLLKDLS